MAHSAVGSEPATAAAVNYAGQRLWREPLFRPRPALGRYRCSLADAGTSGSRLENGWPRGTRAGPVPCSGWTGPLSCAAGPRVRQRQGFLRRSITTVQTGRTAASVGKSSGTSAVSDLEKRLLSRTKVSLADTVAETADEGCLSFRADHISAAGGLGAGL